MLVRIERKLVSAALGRLDDNPQELFMVGIEGLQARRIRHPVFLAHS
jgi:hypothetical protein